MSRTLPSAVITYQGLKLAEGGRTPADDLAVAKPFRFDADPHGGGC